MASIDDMKNMFEGKGDSNVYVVNLRKEIDKIKNFKYKHAEWTPPKKYIELPLGYVYVGQTNLTPMKRLQDHLRDHKAGKGYVRDYSQSLVSSQGKIVKSPLWDLSESFENLAYDDAEKLESWLAWKISLRGYFVWGSHRHKTEEFLGKPPFD